MAKLGKIAQRRKSLAAGIDIKALWETFNDHQEWIDLKTMTEVCFPDRIGDDQRAAVIRALFADRLHFKFDQQRFFPNSPALVAKKIAQREEARRRARLVENAARWLRSAGGTGKGRCSGFRRQ